MMIAKPLKKGVDWTFGALLRAFMRNCFVHPLIRLNYRVTVEGEEELRFAHEGAIVVANHISRVDGPFIVSMLWRHVRIRPTAWHAEYTHPAQWPVMKLFGAVCLGSPKHLPEEERLRRKTESKRIMKKILDAGHPLLIFAEGGIGDGTRVSVPPHYSGVHDMIAAHRDKPVIFVRLSGLEYSAFGKRSGHTGSFRRLPVTMTLTRTGHLSLEGGPQGLNARIERFFNDGVPLATE